MARVKAESGALAEPSTPAQRADVYADGLSWKRIAEVHGVVLESSRGADGTFRLSGRRLSIIGPQLEAIFGMCARSDGSWRCGPLSDEVGSGRDVLAMCWRAADVLRAARAGAVVRARTGSVSRAAVYSDVLSLSLRDVMC
jgi:hypothetical protein